MVGSCELRSVVERVRFNGAEATLPAAADDTANGGTSPEARGTAARSRVLVSYERFAGAGIGAHRG